MSLLPVSEVYGPVWQGEGPDTGRRCSFLRLGHCNLACDWCDTPYTWDDDRFDVDAECPPTSNDHIMAELDRHGTDTVVLTGLRIRPEESFRGQDHHRENHPSPFRRDG